MPTSWTEVEKEFIRRSGRQVSYVGERIATVEVENIYELGKLVALRFIEWVRENPCGVVALPTGRTPEFFIKTLERYKNEWNTESVRKEVLGCGFSHATYPDTSKLTFVMLDEFFPMLPTHRNSFCNYIRVFYAQILGISPDNLHDFDLFSKNVVTKEEMELFSNHAVDLTLLEEGSYSSGEDTGVTQRRRVLKKVAAYCQLFEQKVRDLGGIGFFLGGIGPDGHIAFNQEGCSHDCQTRLVTFNYPTAAAAASDLGGIELAKAKGAMTIGLATIIHNPDVVAIIMAAGEGKATVVKNSIESEPTEAFPATALHKNAGARFYITEGAASALTSRKAARIALLSQTEVVSWALCYLSGVKDTKDAPSHMRVAPADYLLSESIVYDLSIETNTAVHLLTPLHVEQVSPLLLPAIPDWFKDPTVFQCIISCAARRLRDKISGGLIAMSPEGASILHTEPHHDDIMLSYHAAMHQQLGRDPSLHAGSNAKRITKSTSHPKLRSGSFNSKGQECQLGEMFNNNVNHFACLTSGFHSVNDDFLFGQLVSVLGDGTETSEWSERDQGPDLRSSDADPTIAHPFLLNAINTGELSREYDSLLSDFHDAFYANNTARMEFVEHIIFIRKVAEVYKIDLQHSYVDLFKHLLDKLLDLRYGYMVEHTPGDGIPKDIQVLKGCMRESEVDRVWCISRIPNNRIHHMRSKFYTDNFFTPMPTVSEDALPVANLIKERQPDIVTVAYDPEGTGPDTHYKVLQVVAAGLRISLQRQDLQNTNPVVWGYRNVWFEFTPSDATLLLPVTAVDLHHMHEVFMNCFTTQKFAAFPSPHYDGPFSSWAVQIQKRQYDVMRVLLGDDFFTQHSDERVCTSGGFIFIKAMYANNFLQQVEDLRNKFENIATTA